MPAHVLRTPLTAAALVAGALVAAPSHPGASETPGVSILAYHRFGAVVNDSMTVRTATFRRQVEYLCTAGYHVVRLQTVVAYLQGTGPAPPARSVVITADDGHVSVFTDMLPLVREFDAPVTLFIYPSAISHASYAMTWPQLDTLRRTGLFDIESHTYWHPNFTIEKRRLTPDAYRRFVTMQMAKSRATLADRLGVTADLLAWPFGIRDDELVEMARAAGYRAGFTIERRGVRREDPIMALPRFLVTDRDVDRAFAAMLPQAAR